MEPDNTIDRLTGSISDGDPVDWDQVEVDDDLDADTVAAMRDVARISEFHRVQHGTDSSHEERLSPAPSGVPLERWRDLTLLEPMGTGARGEVWRAWDSTLQRQVALKFLQPSAATINVTTDDLASSELLTEARALARLRHPGIVTVFGIGEDRGRIGMWMECVPGTTLAREIERVGALPALQVTRIGMQLCAALESLETAGIVHRDIKPANILLEGDRAVLTDFGLGWRPSLDPMTAPKSSGTPLFMAPEILDGGAPTHQSDLYALGVTLWWALAGEAPFRARTVAELKDEAARGPSQSLVKKCPQAPPDLVEGILRAMHPARTERVRSATDLSARLRAAAAALVPAPSREPSIAVLPFVNRGLGSEDEYFADGIADELIGTLAKVRGLRVAARTSAFTFRQRQITISEIGRALNVDTVLDGSIRRSGDRVRILVQLIRVSDGHHLWAERYDRTLDDIFAVQDDVAQSVVKELRAALLGQEPATASREASAEIEQAAKGRSANPAAHRLYLLGRHFISRLTREDLNRAIQNLNEAVALDPRFARAWAELGAAYMRAATWGLLPQAEAIQRARDVARHALEIEPDLAEAHARLALIQTFHDWDWAGAERSFARAMELAPGDTVVLNGAGVLAAALNRIDDSIALHRKASEQDPLSAAPYSNLGLSLRRAGRLEESETALRKALEIAPQRLLTHANLALTLIEQGRREEALAEVIQEADEGERLYALAVIHWKSGDKAASDSALQALVAGHAENYAAQIAEAYAERAETDTAFDWLERAYAQRDLGLAEIQLVQSYRFLHGDPRWRGLMVKMGFVDGAGV